uniref:Uncharacterized protein n=1 Tax=Melopsittacus undulatus TaxID=13146 RepID=A0A8V5H1C5_MELUD
MSQGHQEDPGSEGQGEKKENASAPPAPPSYEEATAGEGMKSGAYPPPPSVPLHPSWAYVDPSKSFSGYPGDTEMLTTFSWDDRSVRRVFIRKVYAILMVQLLVTVVSCDALSCVCPAPHCLGGFWRYLQLCRVCSNGKPNLGDPCEVFSLWPAYPGCSPQPKGLECELLGSSLGQLSHMGFGMGLPPIAGADPPWGEEHLGSRCLQDK